MEPVTKHRPLSPERQDQGDPFVLKAPSFANTRWPYYCYTTGGGLVERGAAIPVYASLDLFHWDPVGRALPVPEGNVYWAPAVYYIPELPRPYVMLLSKSKGVGEEEHVGHRILRGDSESPEGPFELSEVPVTPDALDFAIDPDVFEASDGTLRLSFAADYVTGERLGTGLMEARISWDLTELLEKPRELARPTCDWQIFNRARRMPWKKLPGVDWSSGATVRWHCIEAPVTVYSPMGRRFVFYSGGCYEGLYAVGIMAEDQDGKLENLSVDENSCLIRQNPEQGLYAPGHCSLVEGPDLSTYVVFHARFGKPDSPRQFAITPLRWYESGMPYCEPVV